MKIIAKPKQEEEVLATVKEDAKAEDVYNGIVEKAECCVVHLCGCK